MAVRTKVKSGKSFSQLNKLKEDKYSFDRLTYPEDNLGGKIPNYMIFYINVPETAAYSAKKTIVEESTSDKNLERTRDTNKVLYADPAKIATSSVLLNVFGDVFSSAGNNNFNPSNLGSIAASKFIQGAIATGVVGLTNDVTKKPKYNRIKSAIALYMPDTVFQTYGHDYDALSVTDAIGYAGLAQRAAQGYNGFFNEGVISDSGSLGAAGAVASAVFSGKDVIKDNPLEGLGPEAVGYIAERSGLVNQGFTDLLLRNQGRALNPQIEMVYKRTQNRTFVFDFRLQARSKKESRNIKNIIKQFKMYAAPSLAPGTGGNYFNIPGQFDIEFMFRNEENKFIGKISTCVLANIDVNYSSAGAFTTFDDGAPVEIQLQLRFTEVDTLTREMFELTKEDEAGF
jgi:hypothetical protein